MEEFELREILADDVITPEEESNLDQVADELLVEDSSLTPTDAVEEFIEVFDSSDSTVAEQVEAVEDAGEEIIEDIVEDIAEDIVDDPSEPPIPDLPIPDEVLERLIAFINDLTVAGTPASDAFQFGSTGTDIILGREGNDVILAVDPQANLPGLGDTDIFSGGSESDVFVLGDRNKPYYNDGDASTSGDDDVAILIDFNPNQDVISLHGSPEDYTLVDFAELGEEGTGTAIFLNGSTNELIGSINNIGGLDLNAGYFQFKNGAAPQPTVGAVEQFGTEGIDLSFSVANNEAGRRSSSVLLAGYTSGSLGRRDRGALDSFISEYRGSSGNRRNRTQQFGTDAIDNAYGVDSDAAGNVYLLSRTNGTLAGANAGIGNDVVFSKFNPRGRRQWQIQFGSPGNDNPFVDPKVDSDGNAIIAGYTNDDLGAANADQVIPPSPDSWISKYDSNGNQIWIEQFGSIDGDETFGLDVDSQDNIYTTGWTTGSLGAPNNVNPDGGNTYDIWLTKYDTDGNQQWIRAVWHQYF